MSKTKGFDAASDEEMRAELLALRTQVMGLQALLVANGICTPAKVKSFVGQAGLWLAGNHTSVQTGLATTFAALEPPGGDQSPAEPSADQKGANLGATNS